MLPVSGSSLSLGCSVYQLSLEEDGSSEAQPLKELAAFSTQPAPTSLTWSVSVLPVPSYFRPYSLGFQLPMAAGWEEGRGGHGCRLPSRRHRIPLWPDQGSAL